MASGQLHTAINNSPSKFMFAFSKAERFPTKVGLNAKVAYDVKG